jgi:hypothetical protein
MARSPTAGRLPWQAGGRMARQGRKHLIPCLGMIIPVYSSNPRRVGIKSLLYMGLYGLHRPYGPLTHIYTNREKLG